MATSTPVTPGLTNYAQIQADEIGVLQSIFMDDFHEERVMASAWQVSRSICVDLTWGQ